MCITSNVIYCMILLEYANISLSVCPCLSLSLSVSLSVSFSLSLSLSLSLFFSLLKREALINKEIEQSVSRMQAVIDLCRYLREKHVIPVKFPLPEVVVVHRDLACHKQLHAMQDYILEVKASILEMYS